MSRLQLELQLLEQGLVAANGGDEVGERVLQPAQPDEAFVVHLLVKIVLCFVYKIAYLLQSFQVPDSRAKEKSEYHIHIVGEALSALLLERNEVEHHVGFEVAHRNGYVALVDNTQWHCCIRRAGTYFLYVGNTQDDEHPAVVVLVACTLVGIADVRNKIIWNVISLF